MASNDQAVGNDVIETGPHLVLEPPTEREQLCSRNNYKVCDDAEEGSAPSETTPIKTTSTKPSTAPAQPPPPSRALRQSTDYSHQISLTIGGIITVAGGFVLAN